MAISNIQSLKVFIADTRSCTNKEEELKLVETTKQEILKKFNEKTKVSGTDKKDYIWKLVYIKLMGYEVDFCLDKILDLLGSNNCAEKYTGYIALSLLVPEENEGMYDSCVNIVRADLHSDNILFQSFALSMIGCLAPRTLAGALIKDIIKIALGSSTSISLFVRKKALLCLLRIFRKFKDYFPNTDDYAAEVNVLLDQVDNLTFTHSLFTFIHGIISHNPSKSWDICLPKIVRSLNALVVRNVCPENYKYYGINCPWIQVKALQILRMVSIPKSNNQLMDEITGIINYILASSHVAENPRINNTVYSILFETINLIIYYKSVINFDLQNQVLSLMAVFMAVPQPNTRYLTLDSMTKILVLPGAEDLLSEQLKTILESLNDKDTSIRRRALDLLYLMCNYNNVGRIVEELLNYTEETEMSVKEELVLKIAILAERFAPNLTWYLDVMIRLMTNSGDYITDDIWFRVVQIITGFGTDSNTNLQRYAATLLFNSLSTPHIHETLVKVGSYVLAEFGGSIIDLIGNPIKLFNVVHKHFDQCSYSGKAMLFNSYAKLARKIPDLRDFVLPIFEAHLEHWQPDLQQRALEYYTIFSNTNKEYSEIKDLALNKMPTFPVDMQDSNPLLTKMVQVRAGAKSKEGNDPTLDIEAKKMLDHQMEIIKARSQQISDTNPTKGIVYEDMFIDPEASAIKFEDNMLFPICQKRLALNTKNIMLTPNNFPVAKNCMAEVKNMLLSNSGTIYQDARLQINYKCEQNENVMKIGLLFMTKTGPINVRRAIVKRSEGLKLQLSPIKLGDSPQLYMIATGVGIINHLPVIEINYSQDAQERALEFALPIFIHKLMKPITMPFDNYENFYREYTVSNNPLFYKLDEFIPNPAPPGTPLPEVLKRFGQLLNNGLKMNVNTFPSPQQIKKIWCIGNYFYKNEAENKEGLVNLPVMVEIEAYEENPGTFRFSLRCGGSPYIIYAIYQIVMLFISASNTGNA